MRPPPALHVHTLTPERLGDHLSSDDPFNQAVTTMTITARIHGPKLRLDDDLQLLDVYTHTFRTGSTKFKNARVVRMQLKSARGLRWISTKCFCNGTLHICGAYAIDVAEFACQRLVQALNDLYFGTQPRYSVTLGNVLLANYRLTLGKRPVMRSTFESALAAGHLPWIDPREMAVVVKMLVEIGTWASIRIFPSGSVALSVPNCAGYRAQLAALGRVCAFLQQL